jgi:S-DNA-T family DNA segregation ATPase FtsK/SpoIIIE
VPILFRHHRRDHHITVRATPEATVADLARLLGGATCAVDGRVADPHLPLADWPVARGAEVTVLAGRPIADDRPAPPRAPRRLAVVGGLDAGRAIALPCGVDVVVGRGAGATLSVDDDTVSERHLRVRDGIVVDLGSTNGTRVDGSRAHLGASTVEVRARATGPQVPLAPPTPIDGTGVPGGWAQAFHRPPPVLPPSEATPVLLPGPVVPSPGATPIGVVALLAPVLLGGVMVVVLHDLLWGLFALLGPVMAAGSWWDQRRRGARLGRRAAHRRAQRMAACAAALGGACSVERDRRRLAHPDLPTIADEVVGPGARLWERRPDHPHFLEVRVGTGGLSWHPPLANAEVLVHPDDEHHDGAVARLVADASILADAPVTVSLAPGAIVGIVGDRRAGRAIARAVLVRAAAAHGPADLGVQVRSDAAEDSWRWADWLPHAPLARGANLVVLDGPELWTGNAPSVRRMLADRAERFGFVALAERAEQLPTGATTIIELVDRHGTARLSGRDAVATSGTVRLEGCGIDWAADVARTLARLTDPEAGSATGRLPGSVRLLDRWHPDHELLNGDADQLADRWARDPDPAPRAAIGLGTEGPVELDLATDGPHLLVAGTTGAGKSELLRTLLVGLAVGAPPAALQFMLIDFKGGSAFDRLADLPHTVGVVTDLSPEGARRTLRSLEAELRARERTLRASGAVDLEDHRSRDGARDRPLARLVVVVDEFATLAREQPESLDALLSIAQRGRSLGIHLVLATQRPAGIVGEALRANLSARVALRLTREADSADVLGAPDAAHLDRSVPGRAIVALGADARRHVQVATTAFARRSGSVPPVELLAEPPLEGFVIERPVEAAAGTDLDTLVELIVAAHRRTRAPAPRPVCLPALPAHLPVDEAPPGALGLHDDADHQRRIPLVWRHADGPLLAVGGPRSGRSTTLLAAAIAACRSAGPDELHVYAIDGARRGLAALADLPHVGGVVGPGDALRQHRVIDHAHVELHRRRAGGSPSGPRILVCIDDLASLLVRWDDDLVDRLGELVTTGAAVGIGVAMAVDRLGAVPVAWQAAIVQRLELRSAGRATALPEDLVAQVAWPEVSADPRARSAPPIRLLPNSVAAGELAAAPTADGWWLPIGIADETLAPVGWTLRGDDHVLVTGPPGSGRSTVLRALAAIIDADERTDLVTVAGRAPTCGDDEPWSRAQVAAADVMAQVAARAGRRLVVLVDDADRLPDDGHGLRDLVTSGALGVHLVLATSSEQARRGFAHVTREVRSRGLGLLLVPDHDLDGELYGVRLPRRAPLGMRPGRGYLVAGGRLSFVQAASVNVHEGD